MRAPIQRLLLATQNAHKRVELAALLEPLGIEVVLPADVGGIPEVDEDQTTFAGNAAKKALSAADATGEWCLADDSGLEVAALGGAPGVNSARYAGRHGQDGDNNAKLLRELEDIPDEARAARFVCALALARPDGTLACELEGTAGGRILWKPSGKAGFGYDPLFLFTEEGFEEQGRAFAELGSEQKARVSHRGRAFRRLVDELPRISATA